jgi:hypothetical protein
MHGGASSSQTLIARGVSEANAMALCDCRMQRSRAIAKNITVEFERQGRPVYEVGDIAADQVAATKAGRLRGRASWRSRPGSRPCVGEQARLTPAAARPRARR